MDKKILLQNLADTLAERTGITKRKAEAFVRSFFEVTEQALTDDGSVKVKNFGTTKIVNVSDRESVNINTGERFQIESHAKISFTPDTFFRDLVNRPFAHFTTILLDEDDEAQLTDTETEIETEETTAKEELVVEEEPVAKEEPVVIEEPVVEEKLVVEEELVEEEEVEEEDKCNSINKTKSPIIINNTLPEPRHNWWRTAFTLLAMVVIALLSYFAGYFRVFCPCNIIGTDAEVITNTERQQLKLAQTDSIALADSLAKAKKDSIDKAQIDSIAKAKAEQEAAAAKKAAEKAAQQLAAQQAAAEKTAQRLAAQQAAAEKATQQQRDLENVQKYQQMPGSNYLITGVMQTIKVRRGENLYMIAKRYYGHKDFARYIIFFNNIEDPNLVTVDQRIKLPRLIHR